MRVSYDIVHVDDGERVGRVFSAIVSTRRRRHRRRCSRARLFVAVREPHARSRAPVDGPAMVLRLHAREHHVAERVLDVDPFQCQRLLQLPLKHWVHIALPKAQSVPPLPVVFLLCVPGHRGWLSRQHACRFEVVQAREHYAPADGVDFNSIV